MDDAINHRMAGLARHLISEYFFDPDREDAYKARIGAARGDGVASMVLSEMASGPCAIVLSALRTLLTFRVQVTTPSLDVAIEGTWSFHTEALLRSRVSVAKGTPAAIAPVLYSLCHDLVEDTLDDEEYAALMDSVKDE